VNIRAREGAILNVAILQNISIALYKDGIVVYSIRADAAGLITILPEPGGKISKFKIILEVEFDKLRVTLISPLEINLAQKIDLFGKK
jgi:hypothetical protein